jgi:hypothetical protein
MIIIPKEKPILENLNSYYLDLNKLCEHFQGEIGCGCIHFRSSAIEGIVFFDKDDILSGQMTDKGVETTGRPAIEQLFDQGGQNSFSVSIYKIDPERVYFWASVPTAQRIYSDLSTEFTDLEGLIKKMASEKLTGYIDVSIADGDTGGILFFNNGVPVGGSYSWSAGEQDNTRESQELLIRQTKQSGGIFHVSRIQPPGHSRALSRPARAEEPLEILPALEEFLVIFEECTSSARKPKNDFIPLLKKKFVEKADNFPFLDPFAAEFEYADQKVHFHGDADHRSLARGLLTCCRELAAEIGVADHLKQELAPWLDKYGRGFANMGISF